jgi:hypothetical protein
MKVMDREKYYYAKVFDRIKVTDGLKACAQEHDLLTPIRREILHYCRKHNANSSVITIENCRIAIRNLRLNAFASICGEIAMNFVIPLLWLGSGAVVGSVFAGIILGILNTILDLSFKSVDIIFGICCSAFAMASAIYGIIRITQNDGWVYVSTNEFKNLGDEYKTFSSSFLPKQDEQRDEIDSRESGDSMELSGY